jgi:hypothetical protein
MSIGSNSGPAPEAEAITEEDAAFTQAHESAIAAAIEESGHQNFTMVKHVFEVGGSSRLLARLLVFGATARLFFELRDGDRLVFDRMVDGPAFDLAFGPAAPVFTSAPSAFIEEMKMAEVSILCRADDPTALCIVLRVGQEHDRFVSIPIGQQAPGLPRG